MGEVYEVRHLRLSGRYAVKFLRREVAALGSQAFQRFQREAEITSGLRHPNIVQIIDFNQMPDGTPFIVMEFLEGVDLAARIEERVTLPLSEVVLLVEQVASALAAAHGRGVIHRDLKPQNLFLVPIVGQPGELVKVLDFGISKVKTDSSLTGDAMLIGTPYYMAPEQARGQTDEIDGRTDQFALAAITYEMLAGARPFGGDTVPAVLYAVVHEEPAPMSNHIDAEVDGVIRKAMSKDKALRYSTIIGFASALRAASAPALRSAIAMKLRNPDAAAAPGSSPTAEGLAPTEPRQSVSERRPRSDNSIPPTPAATFVSSPRGRAVLAGVGGVALAAVVAAAALSQRGAPRRAPDSASAPMMPAAAPSQRGAKPDPNLQARADEIKRKLTLALVAIRGQVEGAVAAAVKEAGLRNAVKARVDSVTFADQFANEDWTRPYRGFSGAVLDGDRALYIRGAPDIEDPTMWRFRTAGAAEPVFTVLVGGQHAYAAASAAIGQGDNQVLVLARVLDGGWLEELAAQVKAPLALWDGSRLIAATGAPDRRQALQTMASADQEAAGFVHEPQNQRAGAGVRAGAATWLWALVEAE